MSSPSTIASFPQPRVLLVEDEGMLRAALVEGLARLPGISVVGAASVAAALREVDATPPSLVISDIDLPDRSGLELLGELGARGLKPHLVFMSAYVKAYRAQIPTYAGVEVLEKPVTLDQLRTLVTQRLRQPVPDASPFGLCDFLQLASLGHHSVLIEVESATDVGQVLVVQGQAWSASDQRSTGIEAFTHLAQAPNAQVRCQAFNADPGLRTLEGSVEGLLLETARLADEAAHARARAPQQLEQPAAPSESFDTWFERGVEASLARRHQAALEAFRAAAAVNPADSKTQANIMRLEELLAESARHT